MKIQTMKKKEVLLVLALFIIGFLLRISFSTCYLWDEYVNLLHAEIIGGFKESGYDEFSYRAAFFPIILAGIYKIYHSQNPYHNQIVASLFVSLLGALSILFIYLAAKEIFNKKVALLSALFLAFLPFHIVFSKILYLHVPAFFFTLLFLFFLKKAENNNKIFLFFLAGCFLSISILTRFEYLLLIPLTIINIVLFREKYNFEKIIFLSSGFVVFMLPFLVWQHLTYGSPFSVFLKQARVTWRFFGIEMPWNYYFTNFFGLASIFALGLLPWIFFKLKERKISKQEIFLVWWFVLPFIFFSMMPYKELRYVFKTIVPIILFSSVGILQLFEKIKFKKIVIVIFIFSLIGIGFIHFLFLQKSFAHWENCGSRIETLKTACYLLSAHTNKENKIFGETFVAHLNYYLPNRKIFDLFDVSALPKEHDGYYIAFENTEFLEKIRKNPHFTLIAEENGVYLYYCDAECFCEVPDSGCINEKDEIKLVELNCSKGKAVFNITSSELCVIGKKNLNLNLENYESISAIIKTSNPVNITFFLHDGKIFSRATEPVLVSANEKKEVEVPFDMIHLWENDFNIENVREVWIGVEKYNGSIEIGMGIIFRSKQNIYGVILFRDKI